MKMKFLAIGAFLLAFGSPVFADETVVFGRLPHAADGWLKLKTYEDELTFAERVLDSAQVSPDGTFCFRFALAEPRKCFVDEGALRAVFFAEPADSLELRLPAAVPLTDAQRLNPFFRPQTFRPEIRKSKSILNQQIAEFDDFFDYLYYQKSMRPNADSLRAALALLDEKFPPTENVYFEQYKAYEKIQLLNLDQKHSPYLAVEELRKLPVSSNNSAFWEMSANVFDSFFTAFQGKREQAYIDKAILEENYVAMDVFLQEYFGFQSPEMREFIVIKSLFDLYFSNERSAFVFSLMKKWEANISDDFNRRLLQRMVLLIGRTQRTQAAADFELPDASGRTHRLADFGGRFVLLNFSSTKVSQAKRELEVLHRFADLYKKELVVMSVFVDETVENRVKKSFAERYVSANHLLLFAEGRSAEILKNYDLSNFPTNFLLDRQHRFLLSDFLLEERFEEKFVEILQKEERQNLENSRRPAEDEWWK